MGQLQGTRVILWAASNLFIKLSSLLKSSLDITVSRSSHLIVFPHTHGVHLKVRGRLLPVLFPNEPQARLVNNPK
jgi:hypothetical protein